MTGNNAYANDFIRKFFALSFAVAGLLLLAMFEVPRISIPDSYYMGSSLHQARVTPAEPLGTTRQTP